jgi:hypothetical protein
VPRAAAAQVDVVALRAALQAGDEELMLHQQVHAAFGAAAAVAAGGRGPAGGGALPCASNVLLQAGFEEHVQQLLAQRQHHVHGAGRRGGV